MRCIHSDLWQTRPFRPDPTFETHAFLWTPATGGNILFAAPGDDQDFDRIADLGGVAHHYITHRDEASSALRRVAERFDSRLHAPRVEADDIRSHAEADVWFDGHEVDERGVELIPTPGHSPGSTSFVVTGAEGARYLFAGDTVFRTSEGAWAAGYIPGISDAAALADSIELLAGYEPDLVLCVSGGHTIDAADWASCARQARDALESPAADGS